MRSSLPDKGKWKTGEQVTEEMMAKYVATCMASGMSKAETAKELEVGVRAVARLMNTDTCKRVMTELGEAAVATAKTVIKTNTADMSELILTTIKHHLKQKNLNAVPIALKVLGFGEEKEVTGPTTIQVVLPGSEAPKDVTTTYEEIKE